MINPVYSECRACAGDGSVSASDVWNAFLEVWEPDFEPCGECEGVGWVQIFEEEGEVV